MGTLNDVVRVVMCVAATAAVTVALSKLSTDYFTTDAGMCFAVKPGRLPPPVRDGTE